MADCQTGFDGLISVPVNCAERLVEIFGSQADVARAFQLDRAVVHNWVKTGYVPARWAGEVERVTEGRISAVDVINEASVKNPVRVKSRPENAPFGIFSEDNMSQYAPAKRIQSFHPPQRTLMGPGPTEIHPRVLTTMSQPAIGYLDPVFVEMMEELKSLLRYVYQTKNPLTFPLSGPGSVGMEFCFVNMVAPGDKVVVCQNGVFGGRMLENVIRCGGWKEWMRFAGANWLMVSSEKIPNGAFSGRDFTRTGFFALASLMMSTELMRPSVMRSTSPAQRAGT